MVLKHRKESIKNIKEKGSEHCNSAKFTGNWKETYVWEDDAERMTDLVDGVTDIFRIVKGDDHRTSQQSSQWTETESQVTERARERDKEKGNWWEKQRLSFSNV